MLDIALIREKPEWVKQQILKLKQVIEQNWVC